MIRNIDRLELLVWTASALLSAPPGRLLVEAREQGTLAVALADSALGGAEAAAGDLFRYVTPPPLSCTQLSALRRSLLISPEGFGGSDGFGEQQAANLGHAHRPPLASRCVVLVTCPGECTAARSAGMRAVAIPSEAGGYVDEDLEGVADACIDSLDELWLDDLSTPGAYWLNPAVPTDDEGYAGMSHTHVSRLDTCRPFRPFRPFFTVMSSLIWRAVDPETGERLGAAAAAALKGEEAASRSGASSSAKTTTRRETASQPAQSSGAAGKNDHADIPDMQALLDDIDPL